MKSNQRKIPHAIALLLSALTTSATMAATPTLIGGGSSLIAPAIEAEITAFPPADGAIQYFNTNSSTGQSAYLNNNAALYGVSGTVDFGNSDAGLLASQIAAYSATPLGIADGPLIQIPYVITPITIPLVNAPTGTGPSIPGDRLLTPTVALNDADLCGIFSGKIVNWAGTPASGNTPATPGVVNPDSATGATYTLNAPITVVYQTDADGTTDLLTRHLHAVCVSGGNSNVAFSETQSFASNFPASIPPSNFIGESGSSGVAAELIGLRAAGIAALGYLGPDYTNTFLAPSSAPAAADNLSVASLFNTTAGVDFTPTATNAALTMINSAPPGTTSNPSDPHVQTNWVPNLANPTTGYPITGTTNLILGQCYANPVPTSPTPTAAVIDFLERHYSNATNAAIIAGYGFSSMPASWVTQIFSDFTSPVSSIAPPPLNIGNHAVCTGTVTGR